MKKILVHVHGGIGNQLFQYAIGHHLALKHNRRLVFDAEWYKTCAGATPRKLFLDEFDFEYDVAPPAMIKMLRFRHVMNRLGLHSVQALNESNIEQHDNDYSVWRLYGSWEALHYFEENVSSILDAFRMPHCYQDAFKKSGYYEQFMDVNSVAVHIRRGDLMAEGASVRPIPDQFYENAVADLLADNEDLKLFVFSDSPKLVEESFGGEIAGVSYQMPQFDNVNLSAPLLDFFAISLCKTIVLSNSTFSWWASLLGEQSGARVIAPDNWQWKIDRDPQEIYRSGWKIIPTE